MELSFLDAGRYLMLGGSWWVNVMDVPRLSIIILVGYRFLAVTLVQRFVVYIWCLHFSII